MKPRAINLSTAASAGAVGGAAVGVVEAPSGLGAAGIAAAPSFSPSCRSPEDAGKDPPEAKEDRKKSEHEMKWMACSIKHGYQCHHMASPSMLRLASSSLTWSMCRLKSTGISLSGRKSRRALQLPKTNMLLRRSMQHYRMRDRQKL